MDFITGLPKIRYIDQRVGQMPRRESQHGRK